MMDNPYYCRNKVYRAGEARRCMRLSENLYCEECNKELKNIKNKILNIREMAEELELDDEFEVHDGYDDSKKKPDFKQKRKSSLQNKVEKQPKPKKRSK